MAMLPDLVRDSKLTTHFLGEETIHTYQESDPTSGNRLIARTEHWQRQKKIGNGAYGSVWLENCTKGQRNGNRVRAVKQSHLDSRSGPVDYTRELEVIAKFSRANYARCFVKSFGWYENAGNICITMEYLERGDLLDYLDHSSSPLSEDETKEITFQILEGLDMMHQNRFAHRDLKPHNILIQSHPPSGWWVKLADFGISKRIEEASGGSTLHGTPGYIAPEIWKLTARGSPYAPDIWALGETTFQLLTKKPAFPNIALLVSYVSNPDTFPVDALEKSGTSQPGIDFVRSLLHPLPSSRPTALVAISQNWIQRKLPELPDPNSSQTNLDHPQRTFTSRSEEFASLNTNISSAEAVTIYPATAFPATVASPEPDTGANAVETDAVESNTVEANDAESNAVDSNTFESNTFESNTFESNTFESNTFESNAVETNAVETNAVETNAVETNAVETNAVETNVVETNDVEANVIEANVIETNAVEANAVETSVVEANAAESNDAESNSTVKPKRPQDLRPTTSISLRGRIRRRDKIQEGFKGRVSHIAFSPDGKTLVAGSGNEINLWNTESPTEKNRSLLAQGKAVHGFAFSPDGKYLASGSQNTYLSSMYSIYLWDLSTLKEVARLREFGSSLQHQEHTNHLCFSPDSTLIASGDSANTVFVWNIHDPERPLYHTRCDNLLGVTFMPSGNLLVVDSTSIFTWNPTTDKLYQTKLSKRLDTRTVRFSSDRSYFLYRLSGSYKFQFRLISTGEIIRTLEFTLRDEFLCMDLSPNDQFIAATHYNWKNRTSRIVIWDALDGKVLHHIPSAHGKKALALAFSPDSQLLATGCQGGILRTWEGKVIHG